MLDLMRFMPRAEIALVSTPNRLSQMVSARLAEVLCASKQTVLGFLYNRSGETPPEVSPVPDLPLLGSIREDSTLEERCGNPSALIKSPAAGELEQILKDV